MIIVLDPKGLVCSDDHARDLAEGEEGDGGYGFWIPFKLALEMVRVPFHQVRQRQQKGPLPPVGVEAELAPLRIDREVAHGFLVAGKKYLVFPVYIDIK